MSRARAGRARRRSAQETLWVSEGSYGGPVLVRGRRVGGTLRPRTRVSRDVTRHPFGGSTSRPRNPYPDCYFFQIDGTDFSETVLFGAIIQP